MVSRLTDYLRLLSSAVAAVRSEAETFLLSFTFFTSWAMRWLRILSDSATGVLGLNTRLRLTS
jgi:hypothetical protein